MSLERLIREGSIYLFNATEEEIDRASEIAHRDLALAERILPESRDWSYSIAYNAVLQASRAYMFRLGYRPASAGSHKTTFEFMQLVEDKRLKESVSYFNRVRKKRHRTIYDQVGLVTEKEARELLKRAREFLHCIESSLKRR